METWLLIRISRQMLKKENTIKFELVMKKELHRNGKHSFVWCGTENSFKPQLIHTYIPQEAFRIHSVF